MRKHSCRRNGVAGKKLRVIGSYWLPGNVLIHYYMVHIVWEKDREFKILMTYYDFILFQCTKKLAQLTLAILATNWLEMMLSVETQSGESGLARIAGRAFYYCSDEDQVWGGENSIINAYWWIYPKQQHGRYKTQSVSFLAVTASLTG